MEVMKMDDYLAQTATADNDVDGVFDVDNGRTSGLVSYLLDKHGVVPASYHSRQKKRKGGEIVSNRGGRIELVKPLDNFMSLALFVTEDKCGCSFSAGQLDEPSITAMRVIGFTPDGQIDLDRVEPAIRSVAAFVGRELGVRYRDDQSLSDILSDMSRRMAHENVARFMGPAVEVLPENMKKLNYEYIRQAKANAGQVKPAVEPALGAEPDTPRRRPG